MSTASGSRESDTSKPLLEAACQFAHSTRRGTYLGVVVSRIHLLKHDTATPECGRDKIHGAQQFLRVRVAGQEGLSLAVGERLISLEFGATGLGQPSDAAACVLRGAVRCR